jgi:tRNA-2-methylthio-N6-dimethylallyladenosine synthase
MKTKYLFINTIGCQMNVYDSEQIAKGLKPLQYDMTPFLEKADLIIVNTCAIREKAEQKVFSFLGRLAGLKKKKPDLRYTCHRPFAQCHTGYFVEEMPYC